MVEVDIDPTTREELANHLGITRDALQWMRRQFYIYLDDCSHMEGYHPLEPYLVWLFIQFVIPSFTLKGRKPGRVKLNRKKIVAELRNSPQKYTRNQFLLETAPDEETRIVEFNGAYIREV